MYDPYDPYYGGGWGPPLPGPPPWEPMGGPGQRRPPQPPPPMVAMESAPMDYYYNPEAYARSGPGRPPGFVQMGPPPMPPMPPMGPPQPPQPPLPTWGEPPAIERQFAGLVGAGNRGPSARVVRFDDDDLVTEGIVIKPSKSRWRAVSAKKVVVQPEIRYQAERVRAQPAPYVDPSYPGFFLPQGYGPPPMAAYVRR